MDVRTYFLTGISGSKDSDYRNLGWALIIRNMREFGVKKGRIGLIRIDIIQTYTESHPEIAKGHYRRQIAKFVECGVGGVLEYDIGSAEELWCHPGAGEMLNKQSGASRVLRDEFLIGLGFTSIVKPQAGRVNCARTRYVDPWLAVGRLAYAV